MAITDPAVRKSGYQYGLSVWLHRMAMSHGTNDAPRLNPSMTRAQLNSFGSPIVRLNRS